jgi:hypothetical protein
MQSEASRPTRFLIGPHGEHGTSQGGKKFGSVPVKALPKPSELAQALFANKSKQARTYDPTRLDFYCRPFVRMVGNGSDRFINDC